MAIKSKTREITITEDKGAFSIFKKLSGKKDEYDFDGISTLRKLLSNQKARLLHVIKTQKPKSLYHLAKILQRDFKAVVNDIKLLDRFGFLDMISEKTGNRRRLRPIVVVDTININLKI